MWIFRRQARVKAVNWFSTIAKKPKPSDHTPTPQRKLIMAFIRIITESSKKSTSLLDNEELTMKTEKMQ